MEWQFEKFSDVSYDVMKKYCFVGTPDWISSQMASYLPVDSSATYLDPCVGRGSLVRALIGAGVREEQITAVDILEDNVEFCRRLWPKVRYVVRDLMRFEETFDYIIGVPPWLKILPAMMKHIASLSSKKCVLLAPFWYGKKGWESVNPLVSDFLIKDLNHLARLALADFVYSSVSCFYEFRKDAVGLDSLLDDWVRKNELSNYFTFNTNESVPDNLVLYEGQKHFLPINPLWFYGFVKGGFRVDKVSSVSILGKNRQGKKSYGLVYDSDEAVDRAREHYTSLTVKKMLICGTNFGWFHLRAV